MTVDPSSINGALEARPGLLRDLKALAIKLYEGDKSKTPPSQRAQDVAEVLNREPFGCMSAAALRLMTRFLEEPVPVRNGVPTRQGSIALVVSTHSGYDAGEVVMVCCNSGLKTTGGYGSELSRPHLKSLDPSDPRFEAFFAKLLEAPAGESVDRLRAHMGLARLLDEVGA